MLERASMPARRRTLTAALGGVVLAGLIVGNAQAAQAAPLEAVESVPGMAASADVHAAAERALEGAELTTQKAHTLTAELMASTLDVSGTTIGTDDLTSNVSWLAAATVVPDPVLREYTERTLSATADVEARIADVTAQFTAAKADHAAAVAAAEAAAEAERVRLEQERIAAEQARIAEEQARQAAEAAAAAAAALASVNTVEGAKATAAAMASSDYGWGADQFQCLESLWERESNWNYQAYNASSGATGIPQSLPGNKMASAGADWETNAATQIKWGLGYIAAVYGTPCGAWGHSESVGWY